MPAKPRPSPVIATRLTRAHLYAACADAPSLLRLVGESGKDLHAAYLRQKDSGMLKGD